jgi:hypothetical protein
MQKTILLTGSSQQVADKINELSKGNIIISCIVLVKNQGTVNSEFMITYIDFNNPEIIVKKLTDMIDEILPSFLEGFRKGFEKDNAFNENENGTSDQSN